MTTQPGMFSASVPAGVDQLLSETEVRRLMGRDMAELMVRSPRGAPAVYRIGLDGKRSVWLSDLAAAMGVSAPRLRADLVRAHARRVLAAGPGL